jgi:PhnB protein
LQIVYRQVMKVTPHVSIGFDGRCEEAFRFYERCLNGTLAFILRWGNSPAAADAPPGWDAKIYHATLEVGDTVINGGDVHPDRYQRPGGFEFVLPMADELDAERVFEALSDGGQIAMPLQETFWARRFGVLVDRFGIRWCVNCERAEPLDMGHP